MKNVYLAVALTSFSEVNIGVWALRANDSSYIAASARNTGVGYGIENSDNDTVFTPMIEWSSGNSAFSAFDFALLIASASSSSLILRCVSGESVKYTLSTLFTSAPTALSIIDAARSSFFVSTLRMLETR